MKQVCQRFFMKQGCQRFFEFLPGFIKKQLILHTNEAHIIQHFLQELFSILYDIYYIFTTRSKFL